VALEVARMVAGSWYTPINHSFRVLPPTIQRERTSPVTWLLLLQVNREKRTIDSLQHGDQAAFVSPVMSVNFPRSALARLRIRKVVSLVSI
jgi:hypothetical protein